MDTTLASFADALRHAHEACSPVRFRGGGTKDFYGQRLVGAVIDTRAYSGIVDYDPTELVITVRGGTPLAEVETALAKHNQMLAFEPPHFGAHATVGGCLAAGLSGPRRASAGAVRDFVLGVSLMNPSGEVLRFGGRVMKNVAGYDVSRLLAGSLGTLGLILDVSFKVLPKPAVETTPTFRMNQATALRRLNEWAGMPLPIGASAWYDGILRLRLSGSDAGVRAARAKFKTERYDEETAAASWWTSAREQTHDFFAGDTPLWRLSLPSTAPVLSLDAEPFIEWGGAQRWWRGDVDARYLREIAAQHGGHATLFRARDKSAGVFDALSPPLLKIHRAIKAELDPHGIFNVGRMYAEF